MGRRLCVPGPQKTRSSRSGLNGAPDQERSKIQAAARRATKKEENEMSNSPIIDRLIAKTRRTDLPEFKAGDTVRVHVKIKEGEKERSRYLRAWLSPRARAH